ncbi:MAG TPA: hypothetical protein VGI47_02685, partial [Candidatus Binataceae bacterium]
GSVSGSGIFQGGSWEANVVETALDRLAIAPAAEGLATGGAKIGALAVEGSDRESLCSSGRFINSTRMHMAAEVTITSRGVGTRIADPPASVTAADRAGCDRDDLVD